MPNAAAVIAENLDRVRTQIERAAQRSGRGAAEVTLVAVTKYVPAEFVRLLYDAGCRDFGESRPQALCDKAADLPKPDARWHLIGHLQRNKARRTLPAIWLLHSLDSLALLEEIEKLNLPPLPALVEVNVSGDSTKHGLAPELVESFLIQSLRYPCVALRGLMCMAAREGDSAVARQNFRDLRRLRDRLKRVVRDDVELPELSMGMSGDYVEAIEEGATLVRIGSALFEGLEAPRT